MGGAGGGEVDDGVTVDGGGGRLVCLGAVDVGPGGGVDHHVVAGDGGVHGGGVGDVQVGAGGGGDLVVRPRFDDVDQVASEHPAGPGHQEPHAFAAFSGSHQARLSRYHLTVSASPVSRVMLGAYPSSLLILVMSRE